MRRIVPFVLAMALVGCLITPGQPAVYTYPELDYIVVQQGGLYYYCPTWYHPVGRFDPPPATIWVKPPTRTWTPPPRRVMPRGSHR